MDINEKDYKYDVAFSFLQEDEDLANKINELIKDRLTTFIYSEKQLDIAGKDGEIEFGNVFRDDARCVVVLYRQGWGETPWTRIEETSIRGRAYEEGYDFALFALLDKASVFPKWLPRNRIWIGIERYGIEGAASVIDARLQDLGAKSTELTPVEEAIRLSKELEFEKERQAFLQSTEAVAAANEEIKALFAELDLAIAKAAEQTRDISGSRSSNKYAINVAIHGLLLDWNRPYSNSIDSSALYIYVFDHPVLFDGNYFPGEKPRRIDETEYGFDINRNKATGWRPRHRTDLFYTSKDLARLCIVKIITLTIESRKRNCY